MTAEFNPRPVELHIDSEHERSSEVTEPGSLVPATQSYVEAAGQKFNSTRGLIEDTLEPWLVGKQVATSDGFTHGEAGLSGLRNSADQKTAMSQATLARIHDEADAAITAIVSKAMQQRDIVRTRCVDFVEERDAEVRESVTQARELVETLTANYLRSLRIVELSLETDIKITRYAADYAQREAAIEESEIQTEADQRALEVSHERDDAVLEEERRHEIVIQAHQYLSSALQESVDHLRQLYFEKQGPAVAELRAFTAEVQAIIDRHIGLLHEKADSIVEHQRSSDELRRNTVQISDSKIKIQSFEVDVRRQEAARTERKLAIARNNSQAAKEAEDQLSATHMAGVVDDATRGTLEAFVRDYRENPTAFDEHHIKNDKKLSEIDMEIAEIKKAAETELGDLATLESYRTIYTGELASVLTKIDDLNHSINSHEQRGFSIWNRAHDIQDEHNELLVLAYEHCDRIKKLLGVALQLINGHMSLEDCQRIDEQVAVIDEETRLQAEANQPFTSKNHKTSLRLVTDNDGNVLHARAQESGNAGA